MTKLLPTLSLALTATATSVFGQVLLQDDFSYHGNNQLPTDLGGGVYGYEIDTTGFSATGHKLILSYSTKREKDLNTGVIGDDIGVALFTQITFNGVSLTKAIDEFNFNRGTAGIWYLDDVLSDGTLRLETSITEPERLTDFGVGIYALDGLKAGVQDTAFGNADSESTVSVTTASGFVVQEAVRNNQSLTPSGTDDFETLYNYSSNSYRGLEQYQVTNAAGDYFAPTSNTATKLVMGASFDAVPEPGSFALLAGMFGLTWVMLRRRS